MLCHVTRPDSVVMEVEVDAKANGEDCLNKVKTDSTFYSSLCLNVKITRRRMCVGEAARLGLSEKYFLMFQSTSTLMCRAHL